MSEHPPETFVTPATPRPARSTIDPSANIPQRDALSDGSLPPKDFTTYMPSNLPTPPFIFVPGVPNFRDLGGYACPPPVNLHASEVTNASGQAPRFQIRRGLLFRCAHPTQLTPTGLMTLDALGITDMFDLRSATELAKLSAPEPDAETPFLQPGGHIELPGITRHFTPVYTAEDYSPVALAKKLQWYTAAQNPGADYSEGFVAAYRDIGTFGASSGSYAKILRQVIRSMAAEEQREKEDAEARRRPRPGARPVSVYADLNGILTHLERYPSPDPSSKLAAAGGAEAANPPNDNDSKNTTATTTTTTATAPPQPPPTTLQATDGGEAIRQNGGIIFHCTAGKDRTGVLAALILYLCGVDMEDIAWEYAITEPGLGSWRRIFIDRMSKSGLGSGGGGGQSGGTSTSNHTQAAQAAVSATAAAAVSQNQGNDKTNNNNEEVGEAPKASAGGVAGAQKDVLSRAEAARICGSRAGNIRQFLRVVVDGEWGGVESYLKGMVGLQDHEIDDLKLGLVVRVPDGEVEEEEEEAVVVRRREIDGWTLEGGMDEDREL